MVATTRFRNKIIHFAQNDTIRETRPSRQVSSLTDFIFFWRLKGYTYCNRPDLHYVYPMDFRKGIAILGLPQHE